MVGEKPDNILPTKRSAEPPMNLDSLKLQDKDAIKLEIMRQLEGEIASVKMDALKKGFVSKVDAPVQPMVTRIYKDKPGDMNADNHLNLSRPGTNSAHQLSIFSSDDSLADLPQQKYASNKNNAGWSIPFQINKPPLADINIQAEMQQKYRDPRKDIKYFSFDDSSDTGAGGGSTYKPTTVNYVREKEIASVPMGASSLLRQSGTRALAAQPPLPGEAREEIIRALMQAQEEKYKGRSGDIKRVDTVYRGLIGDR